MNDYQLNLVDLKRLSDEEIKKFRSDLKYIANFIKYNELRYDSETKQAEYLDDAVKKVEHFWDIG